MDTVVGSVARARPGKAPASCTTGPGPLQTASIPRTGQVGSGRSGGGGRGLRRGRERARGAWALDVARRAVGPPRGSCPAPRRCSLNAGTVGCCADSSVPFQMGRSLCCAVPRFPPRATDYLSGLSGAARSWPWASTSSRALQESSSGGPTGRPPSTHPRSVVEAPDAPDRQRGVGTRRRQRGS